MKQANAVRPFCNRQVTVRGEMKNLGVWNALSDASRRKGITAITCCPTDPLS